MDNRRKKNPVRGKRIKPQPKYSFWAAKPTYIDYQLIIATFFLVSVGLVMLYSASAYSGVHKFNEDMYYFGSQIQMTIIGVLAMIFTSRVNYHQYGRLVLPIYGGAVILMALVRFTGLGVVNYGARRWLRIPVINKTVQPSEVAKIAIIILTAYLVCGMVKHVDETRAFLVVMAVAALTAVMVWKFTDNLSTGIIVGGISFIMLFVARSDWKPFIICGVIAAVIGAIAVFIAVETAGSGSFRMVRILTWIDQEKYSAEGGYQVLQGLYAIGSGGFWGKGLGNSTQKLGVIPEVQNDMILSVICEELGIFGVILILALFGYLIYRMILIAQNAPDMFGALLVVGVIAHISLQVILNIAVVTNIIPTTGITLPFFSFGGTSIICLLSEIGIVIGVAGYIKIE